MFLHSKRGYTREGQQWARGRFLILMRPSDDSKAPMRGIVRYARMSQLGHFMMATVTIAEHEISLSGTYGADGLTCDVPRSVYDLGVDVPADLVKAWNEGGGHNSAGSEGAKMHAWAIDTFTGKKKINHKARGAALLGNILEGAGAVPPKERKERRPRANPKVVDRMRQFYASTMNACIREHWTCERYIQARNAHETLPRLTRADSAEIYAYSRFSFDAINNGILLDWRLGFADVASAYPTGQFPWEGDASVVPTHGAHFWKGSDDLWNDWKDMSPAKKGGE